MLRRLLFLFALCLIPSVRAADDAKVYELRVYQAAEGKLDALHARFRDHTLKLFDKHGITSVGYWVPSDNKANTLYFLLSYPSRAARDKSWTAFLEDPDTLKAFQASEKNGKLVDKVEQFFLTTTDYSPPVKVAKAGDRVFELRIYTATPKNLEHLNARFRDHTLKLFEKHGMTNFGYFVLTKDQKDVDKMLYYFLAHKSEDAAKASFTSFRADPDWVKARAESEKKAGGSLTELQRGVRSIILKPTDYSPTK